MFESPTKDDAIRMLSKLSRKAQQDLSAQRISAMTSASQAGAIQSTGLIVQVAESANEIYVGVLQQATLSLRDFALRMKIAPSQIVEWARPVLKELWQSLLAEVPKAGFPNEHARIVALYGVQLNDQLEGALRDTEIGFSMGAGFIGQSMHNEWLLAKEALAVLAPSLGVSSAMMGICKRAHAGLIRARAEHFLQRNQEYRNHDIPKEFWWAEGHQALEQDWAVGDFSTWIEQTIQMKAFGVTFSRVDIEKLIPPSTIVPVARAPVSGEDEEIIRKLDALVPSAALSFRQSVLDLNDDQRVSFRGPALELREALREVLHFLAPDSEVMAVEGYVQEKERDGPTTRQRVRFIMKKNGKQSSSGPPEQAALAFELSIAGLTRDVQTRTSELTHVAGERKTVLQLHRYVVVVLHEILGP
jgi:hypothetical protein